MKSTFRILFYLKKNEPKKDGTVTIMARITVDGETKQFSTKKTILPEDWDIKSGRAVNKSGKSTSAKISKLNKELDDLRGQISIQYTKQLNNNGYVEPEKLRNNVLGIEEKQHSLLTYFTEHNLQYKDKVGTTTTQKTYSRYELTKQRLIDFMKVKYRVSDILIREINAVFIENFYLYLRNEHGINNNTAMKFVQRFHSVLIYAKNSGLNFVDPFGSFKFSFDKVDRGYLNQDEIDLIYNKEFSSARLTQVRDMFIFSCYTGLSYIDKADGFTIEDLENNKKWKLDGKSFKQLQQELDNEELYSSVYGMASDPIHSDWGEISQLHLIANNEEGVMCANKDYNSSHYRYIIPFVMIPIDATIAYIQWIKEELEITLLENLLPTFYDIKRVLNIIAKQIFIEYQGEKYLYE